MKSAKSFGESQKAEYGFQPALDHLSIPGLCPACAASGER
jgi:hypothetical protein